MTLDTYHAEWAKDADVPLDRLDEAARLTYLLHDKWWRHRHAEKAKWIKAKDALDLLSLQKREWYHGDLDDTERTALGWPPQERRIRGQKELLERYLLADADLQQARARVLLAEETLRFIEDNIDCLKKRNFQIKNIIDFLRFKTGGG